MNAVVGGGPAGFFAAIACREADPSTPVVVLEKGARVLRKVKVSGGGRCNVTNACTDPRALAGHFPRGHRELIGPFTRFGSREAAEWFTARGVPLRTYPDGCLFPESDSSQTIIDCLTREADRAGVQVELRRGVAAIRRRDDRFRLEMDDGPALDCVRVLIATGGKAVGPGHTGRYEPPGRYEPTGGYALAAGLGHGIATPVPSLFTFIVGDPLLKDLAGIVVPDVRVRVLGGRGKRPAPQGGPLLVTHWGLSGPAILQLSAWGARTFHECGYAFTIAVDWAPAHEADDLERALREQAGAAGQKRVDAFGLFGISRRLWERLVARAGVPDGRRWSELGRKQRAALVRVLKGTELAVAGQSTFKDEFVACGGVPLRDVDFRTMESRIVPGLHFAGEVLDIDGVTGGFNFQACWTTGWLAGRGMAGDHGENRDK